MNNNKKITVVWHADNLRTLHVNPNMVRKLIDKLSACDNKEANLTIHT